MHKKLITLALLALLAGPTAAVPMLMELGVAEMADEQVAIAMDGNAALVTGGQGLTLEVVSLTGRRVATVAIDSPAQRVELNNLAKGCYILKIGKLVKKVSIK